MGKVKLKHIDKLKLILILFMVFALMPNLISIAGHSFKAMYFIFVIMSGIIFSKQKIKKPNSVILYLFFYMFLVSLLAVFHWGIDRLLINYCFGFVVIAFFMTLGSRYAENEWMEMLQKVWILLVFFVLINNLRQYHSFIEYFQYGLDHPYITTLVTGGVNLEATWISILTLSFFNYKKRWIPFILSSLIALLYASRAGIIAVLVVAFVFIYGKLPSDSKNRIIFRRSIFTILGVIALSLVIIFSFSGGLFLQVVSRFADIGHDAGSLGRFAMWNYVFGTVEKYPLGVGLGNVIPALETVSPFRYEEDNIHNIYLQMFIEIGILGGMAYLGAIGSWIFRNVRQFFKSPIIGMICIYFLLCLFQFRGGETIFFCLIGIYLCIKANKKNMRGRDNEKNIGYM